jgi:toxin CptA
MPGKGATNITIRLGYSRQMALYLLSLHGLALGLLLLLPLPWAIRIVPAFLIVCGLAYSWRLHLLRRGGRAVTAIEWNGEEQWFLFDSRGTPARAFLSGSSYVHPRLLVLNFRIANGPRRSLCLTADGVGGEQLRRLRVRLRGYSAGR